MPMQMNKDNIILYTIIHIFYDRIQLYEYILSHLHIRKYGYILHVLLLSYYTKAMCFCILLQFVQFDNVMFVHEWVV